MLFTPTGYIQINPMLCPKMLLKNTTAFLGADTAATRLEQGAPQLTHHCEHEHRHSCEFPVIPAKAGISLPNLMTTEIPDRSPNGSRPE